MPALTAPRLRPRFLAGLSLAGCSVAIPAPAADDRAAAPDFVGIELGPGILKAVREPKRIDDWSQREIDAYYEVLRFVRTIDSARQKQQARENLRAEVERYRREAEDEYVRRIKQIEADSANLGLLKTTRHKATAAARRRKRLELAETFESDPAEFRLFARIANSLLPADPQKGERSRFHGKLVTLHGHIRKLVSYPAHENRFGVKQLHEAWIYTKYSGTNPAVVICTSLPKGIPTGDRIMESVSVTGYAFRMHKYPDKADKIHYAPMILASTIEWHPRKEPKPAPSWWGGAVAAIVVLILVALVLVARRDKAAHRKQIERAIQDGESEPRIAPPDDVSSPDRQ
jgi:hypothetical protein